MMCSFEWQRKPEGYTTCECGKLVKLPEQVCEDCMKEFNEVE